MQTCKSRAMRPVIEAIQGYLNLSMSSSDSAQMHLHGTGEVGILERKLCRLYGVKHALCVSNCTTGLLAAALSLDLRNTEVLVPAITYGASVAGLLLLGNRLRFCDVDPNTLTMSADAVRRAITRNTRAILAVDMFGVPADSLALRKIADEYALSYISDSAQSLGATRSGRPAGWLADAVVVSFTCGKPVFAGEGGAILTNSDELYQKVIWFTQHPYRQKRELGLHLTSEFNLNARIHPLAAIWASTLFDHSLRLLRQHQRRCSRLIRHMDQMHIVDPMCFEEQQILPTFFRLTAALRRRRDAAPLVEALRKLGFRVQVSFSPITPIYRHVAFQVQFASHCVDMRSCPVAEDQATRRVELRYC